MQAIRFPSLSYTPPPGISPFTAATHLADHKPTLDSPTSVRPHFGNAALGLPPITNMAYKVFGPIWRNRGIELLAIDMVAWAGLRSLMDLYREHFFRKTLDNQRHFNWAAGRERLMLEIMGAMPDGLGLVAAMLGIAWEGKKNAFSRKFVDLDTLNYFKSLTAGQSGGSASQFAAQLAKDISPHHQIKVASIISKWGCSEKAATDIAKLLGQNHFDVAIKGNTYAMDVLLNDAKAFVSHLPKNNGFWGQAGKLLEKTASINAVRIPLALGLGVLFNFSAPYIIQHVTRKVDKVADYPGLHGLKVLDKVSTTDKSHHPGLLPYLRRSFKHGNLLPILVSLAPLPIISGMIDTEKLALGGIRAAFNSPLKAGFLGRALKMMQFSRSFPFAGAQQMAMLYALVVFSRVAAARNSIEFRERTVDAFLGWSTWILFTPWLKHKASQWIDKTQGTMLMKTVHGETSRRTEAEILKLIGNKALRAKTLSRFTWLNVASIASTIALLGVLEPYASIKLTEWQSQWFKPQRSRPHQA